MPVSEFFKGTHEVTRQSIGPWSYPLVASAMRALSLTAPTRAQPAISKSGQRGVRQKTAIHTSTRAISKYGESYLVGNTPLPLSANAQTLISTAQKQTATSRLRQTTAAWQ